MNITTTEFMKIITTESTETHIIDTISWIHSKISVPILFVVALFTAIGNTILLFIMLRSKGFKKTYVNWLMIFLSFADNIYAYSIIYIIIHKNWIIGVNDWNHLKCILESSSKFFGLLFACIITLFMAYDRFVAINFPMYYQTLEVRKRILITFAITLIWDAISMFLLFFRVNMNERVPFCTGSTSTSGIFGAYFSIMSTMIAILVIGFHISVIIGLKIAYKNRERRIMVKSQQDVFRRISAIIIAYVIFWAIPTMFNFIVTFFVKDHFLRVPSEILMVIGSGLNSFANLIIFYARSSEIRRLFIKQLPNGIVKRFLKKTQERSPELNERIRVWTISSRIEPNKINV